MSPPARDSDLVALPQVEPWASTLANSLAVECQLKDPARDTAQSVLGRSTTLPHALQMPRREQAEFLLACLLYGHRSGEALEQVRVRLYHVEPELLRHDVVCVAANRLLRRHLPWDEESIHKLSTVGLRAQADFTPLTFPVAAIARAVADWVASHALFPQLKRTLDLWSDEVLFRPFGAWAKPSYSHIRRALGTSGPSFADANAKMVAALKQHLAENPGRYSMNNNFGRGIG